MVRPTARSPGSSPRLAAPLLVALLAGAPMGTARGQPLPETIGSEPLVAAVSFRGVASVAEADLQSALATQPVRCRSLLLKPFCLVSDGGFFEERPRLDPEELPRDALRIQVLYWLRGYRAAGVTYEVLPRGGDAEVVFTVEEGPPTVARSVDVVQDTAILSEGDIELARLPAEGEPVDMIRLRTAADLLLDELRDRGFADAAVRDTVTLEGAPGPDGNPGARVRLLVEPGRPVTVGVVEVLGNEGVSDRTIRRLTELRPGQLYRRGDLEEAQRRLFGSGMFRRSTVQGQWADTVAGLRPPGESGDATTVEDSVRAVAERLARSLPDTARPVVVSVIEAPDREMELGAGVSTVEFVQLQVRHTRYDFLGDGRRLDVGATVGNLLAPQLYGRSLFESAAPAGVEGEPEGVFLDPTWSVSLGFTQPWFLSTRTQLGVELLASRRIVPGVVVDRTAGASVAATRRVAAGIDLTLAYRFEETRVQAGDVYFCVNFGVCRTPTIEALREPRHLSPIRVTGLASRLEQPLNPVSGYTARVDVEYASTATASDYGYTRVSGETTRHHRLGPGVLAWRARGGWVGVGGGKDDVLHPRKRFFAGGARSVRGYAENQLGPRILTVPASALMEEQGGGDEAGGRPGCTESEVRTGSCDPSGVPVDRFVPRPLGGDAVIEGSLEYRFPVFGLASAVFIDAAWVGDRDLEVASPARAAVTPGFGVRYSSPIGLIRIDLGIRPTLAEDLPVVTRIPGEDRLVTLETLRRYDPVGGSGGFFGQIVERLVLHLSVGEAF